MKRFPLTAVLLLTLAGCQSGPSGTPGQGPPPPPPAPPAEEPAGEEEGAPAAAPIAGPMGFAPSEGSGPVPAAEPVPEPRDVVAQDAAQAAPGEGPRPADAGDAASEETAGAGDVKEKVDVAPLPAGPVDPAKSLKVYEEARKLIEQGKAKKATELFEEWLRVAPADKVNRQNLVHVYLSTGQDDAALLHLKILAEQDPNQVETWAALGRLQAKLGKHSQAAESLMLATGLAPADVDLALDLSREFAADREYVKAGAVLETILKRGKRENEILKELGAVLVLAGEYRTAWARYEKLQRLQPTYETALVLSQLAAREGKCNDVKDSLAGWDKEFKDEAPYLLLAGCALEAKDINKAQSYLSSAVEKNGQCFDCALKLGDVFFERRDWPNAAQFYAKAAELKPSEFWPHMQLGKSLANAGKHVEAARAFGSANERKPGDADVVFAWGIETVLSGDKATGWKIWGMLDELDKAKAAALKKELSK